MGKRSTDLTAITGGSLASGDLFPVFDVSADELKSLTLTQAKLGVQPAYPYIKEELISSTSIYLRRPGHGTVTYSDLLGDGSFDVKRQIKYELFNENWYDGSSYYPMSPIQNKGDDSFRVEILNHNVRVSYNHLPINRPYLTPTFTSLGGGLYTVSGVTLINNVTGYLAGQTLTGIIETQNPAQMVTQGTLSASVEETSPGSGVYQIQVSSITISSGGSFTTNTAADYTVYLEPAPNSAQDLGPDDVYARNNMTAGVTGTVPYALGVSGPARISNGTLTNPFSTTSGSKTVTVSHTSHGLVTGDRVEFHCTSAVGGIIVGQYNGGDFIVTKVDNNTYTISNEQAATSTVSGGGGTVYYWYGRIVYYGQNYWQIVDAAVGTPYARYIVNTGPNTWGTYNVFTADKLETVIYGANLRVTDANSGSNAPAMSLYSSKSSTGVYGSFNTTFLDSAGNYDTGTQIQYRTISRTSTSEETRMDFSTVIAGSLGTRFFIGSGAFANGASDPGAGRIAALGFNAFTSDDGATAGPSVVLNRFSNSPAANDVMGFLTFQGRNSSAANMNYAQILSRIVSPTAASESAALYFATYQSGTFANRLFVGAGVYTNAQTDPGADGIAASTFWANGSLAVDAANGLRLPSYAATAIAAIGNAVNTANKAAGKMVWDTTNNRVMVASGSTAGSNWYVCDGSASVTPV